MTPRSVILGLLGGMAICAFCYFNDFVIRQGMLIPHQLPPIVYGSLVLAALVVHLVLRRVSAQRALSAAELAVIAGLCLVASGIPGWGLIQCVPPTAIMTHHYARIQPSWRSGKVNVVETVPKQMLVDLSGDDDTILNGYVRGLAEGDRHIAISAVPWGAWAGTLQFWMAFVVSLTIAVLGLAVVLHRQWSEHEGLSYPISVFAHALLPGEGQGERSVFRKRMFWGAMLFVLVVYLNNYITVWFPKYLIPIKFTLDLSPLYGILPFLNGPGFYYNIAFAVLGLAYFLRSSVSLSVGIVPYLHTAVCLVLRSYGVSLDGGEHLGGNYNTFLFAGGYVGVLLLMLYTGRHYYWNALHQGLFFPVAAETPTPAARWRRAAGFGGLVLATLVLIGGTGWLWTLVWTGAAVAFYLVVAPKLPVKDPVDAAAVWGVRVFLAGTLVCTATLVWVGLDWQFAVLFTGITIMTFVVVSRIVAETGAFHFGTFFLPGSLIMGFMGAAAVGPKAMVIMSLASSAILLAPGWAPMPFMIQALKLTDLAKVRVLQMARWSTVLLLLCIPVALFSTLYWSYDRGAPMYNWPQAANEYPGRNVVTMTQRLEGQGTLELANSLHGWDRFRHMTPDRPRVTAFFITAVLCMLCGWCNLRFTWWPFHPVMFLFLGSFHGQWISVSLLIGCAVKVGVIRYGGAALYNRLKPLMIGLIAGAVVAALVPTVVGAIYYLVTGLPPIQMWWVVW